MKSKFALLLALFALTTHAQWAPTPISALPNQQITLSGTELFPLEQSNGSSGTASSSGIAYYVLAQLSSTQIINLWTGTCSSTTFLNGAGVCTTAGSGTGVGNVVTTGTPTSGALAEFTGAASITSSNLSGDCTTSGTLAVTCLQTNGVSFGNLATANAATPPALGGTTPAAGNFSLINVSNSLSAANNSTAAHHNLLSNYQILPGSGNFNPNGYLVIGGGGGNYLTFGQNPGSSTDPSAQWIQSGFSSSSPTYYDIALNPVGGGVTVGGVSGEGTGTINVSGGYYVNGVLLSSGVTTSGSFTATATDISGSPTGTVYWSAIGNMVTISMPVGVSGTSTATTLTLSGLPTGITPARTEYSYSVPNFEDNSTFCSGVPAVTSSHTIIFAKQAAGAAIASYSGWTASGGKSVAAFTITYTLN